MLTELLERFEELYMKRFEKLTEDEYHAAEMCAVLLHAQYSAVNDYGGLRLLEVKLNYIRRKRSFFDNRPIGALNLKAKRQKEIVCVGCIDGRIDCYPVVKEKKKKVDRDRDG